MTWHDMLLAIKGGNQRHKDAPPGLTHAEIAERLGNIGLRTVKDWFARTHAPQGAAIKAIEYLYDEVMAERGLKP